MERAECAPAALPDPRDALLHHQCPVLPVPRFGPFAPLAQPGQRMLLASNGLFIEVRTTALYALQRAGQVAPGLALPYGRLQPQLELAYGRLPRTLIEAFMDAARLVAPHELAGALVYDPLAGLLELVLHTSVLAHAQRVEYRLPPLAPQQVVALDLHSHGHGPAFFSEGDNLDDRGMCLAMVVGDLQHARPSVAFRLCLNGLLLPQPHPWQHAPDTGGIDEWRDTGSSPTPAKE